LDQPLEHPGALARPPQLLHLIECLHNEVLLPVSPRGYHLDLGPLLPCLFRPGLDSHPLQIKLPLVLFPLCFLSSLQQLSEQGLELALPLEFAKPKLLEVLAVDMEGAEGTDPKALEIVLVQ
jgi:hypothetical protein